MNKVPMLVFFLIKSERERESVFMNREAEKRERERARQEESLGGRAYIHEQRKRRDRKSDLRFFQFSVSNNANDLLLFQNV